MTGLATCIYLAQIMLPGTLLRFITSRLRYSAARRRIELVSRLLTLCGTALVILNIPFVLISYVSESGRLENGPLFRLYVLYMLAYYLLDLGYVWYRRQELGIHNRRTMTEACVCAIIGLVFQHFLHAQLFFGFTLAVAVTFLYLTLKNPYAYIDVGTRLFHAAYFDIWMEERLHSHRRGCLVAADFYWLEHHVQLYSATASSELAVAVADSLWGIESRPKLFRLTSNCFVFWSEDEQQADTLLQRCQERLRRPIRVKGYSVHCPAVLVKIPLEGGAADVEKLRSYITFSTKQADCQGETYVVENSKALREQFEYQTEVERFLWDAVQQDRFELWYQPIYSREEDRFVALEALSRLKHPKLGWIPPELFIRLAERNGLLFQIMPRQFEKICSFLYKHPDLIRTLQSVKVNLSPQELAEVGYCDKLLDMIR